jgi:hypothetical protein
MTQDDKDRLEYLIKYFHALNGAGKDGVIFGAITRTRKEIEKILDIEKK